MVRTATEGRLDPVWQLLGLLQAGKALLELFTSVVGVEEEMRTGCGLSDEECYRLCAWPAALLRPAAAALSSGGTPAAWDASPLDRVAEAAVYLSCACQPAKMLIALLLANRGAPYSQRTRTPTGLASPAAVAEFMHSVLFATERLQNQRGESGHRSSFISLVLLQCGACPAARARLPASSASQPDTHPLPPARRRLC